MNSMNQSHHSTRKNINNNSNNNIIKKRVVENKFITEYQNEIDKKRLGLNYNYNNDIKYKSKSKDKFIRLKEEIREKFKNEHTFKPNVVYTFAKTKVDRDLGDQQEFYNRLSEPKVKRVNERMKKKEELENSKLKLDCPFKPAISTNSRNMATKKAVDYDYYNSINIGNELDKNKSQIIPNNKIGIANERLFKLSEQLREKREKMRRDYLEKKENEFKFAPQIFENSKNLMKKYENQVPIYERYNEVAKNKQELIYKKRAEVENIETINNNHHVPKINKKSVEILNRKKDYSCDDIRSRLPVNERLYILGCEKVAKKKEIKNEVDPNCTFTPLINNSSINQNHTFQKEYYNKSAIHTMNNSTMTQRNDVGNINDFLNRQKIYEDIKYEKLEKIRNKSMDIKQQFKPQINITSDILMRADITRSGETKEEKINRLYKKDIEKYNQRKKVLEEFYYSQYDFKPKINQVSKFVGRDTKLDELSKKIDSDKVKALKANSELEEEYSFKPEFISKKSGKYSYVQSGYALDEGIMERINNQIESKKETIEIIKRKMEQEELKEAVFQPELNEYMPNFNHSKPIQLKGFAQHLEKMNKARKAKLEKEEREKEVFITGENWSRDHLITIPKPFKLSYVRIIFKKRWIIMFLKKQRKVLLVRLN